MILYKLGLSPVGAPVPTYTKLRCNHLQILWSSKLNFSYSHMVQSLNSIRVTDEGSEQMWPPNPKLTVCTTRAETQQWILWVNDWRNIRNVTDISVVILITKCNASIKNIAQVNHKHMHCLQCFLHCYVYYTYCSHQQYYSTFLNSCSLFPSAHWIWSDDFQLTSLNFWLLLHSRIKPPSGHIFLASSLHRFSSTVRGKTELALWFWRRFCLVRFPILRFL